MPHLWLVWHGMRWIYAKCAQILTMFMYERALEHWITHREALRSLRITAPNYLRLSITQHVHNGVSYHMIQGYAYNTVHARPHAKLRIHAVDWSVIRFCEAAAGCSLRSRSTSSLDQWDCAEWDSADAHRVHHDNSPEIRILLQARLRNPLLCSFPGSTQCSGADPPDTCDAAGDRFGESTSTSLMPPFNWIGAPSFSLQDRIDRDMIKRFPEGGIGCWPGSVWGPPLVKSRLVQVRVTNHKGPLIGAAGGPPRRGGQWTQPWTPTVSSSGQSVKDPKQTNF